MPKLKISETETRHRSLLGMIDKYITKNDLDHKQVLIAFGMSNGTYYGRRRNAGTYTWDELMRIKSKLHIPDPEWHEVV